MTRINKRNTRWLHSMFYHLYQVSSIKQILLIFRGIISFCLKTIKSWNTIHFSHLIDNNNSTFECHCIFTAASHTTHLADMQTNGDVEAFEQAKEMCLSEMEGKMTFWVERRASGRILRGNSTAFHPSYLCFQRWWKGWAWHCSETSFL